MLPLFHAMLGAVDAQIDLLVSTNLLGTSSTNTRIGPDSETRTNIGHGLAEQELLQRAWAAERTRQPWHLRRVHSFTGYGP